MKLMHLDTNSSTSTPVDESPKAISLVLLYVRSAAVTSKRESIVASEVCFTFLKSSFDFLIVCTRPVEFGCRYSARESRQKLALCFEYCY
jgi:hypothetical protein